MLIEVNVSFKFHLVNTAFVLSYNRPLSLFSFQIILNFFNSVNFACHICSFKKYPKKKILDQFTDYLITEKSCDQVFIKKLNNY